MSTATITFQRLILAIVFRKALQAVAFANTGFHLWMQMVMK
jgi:hypothetical protein